MSRSPVSCVYIYLSDFHFSRDIPRILLDNPGVGDLAQHVELVLGFFVVEAKDRDVKLGDHVPQVTLCRCDKAEVQLTSLFPDSTELLIGQEN